MLLRCLRIVLDVVYLTLLGPGSPAPRRQRAPADTINPPPKVPLAFNRLYNYPELEAGLRQLEKAHPGLLRLTSVGKSVEGRDLWCMVINNAQTGNDRSKAAMYVDGNIHGNEIQAGEACLYLIWYLTENYDRVPRIKEIVDERTFYVVPTINPDGRAHWFDAPNTENSSRSGKAPRDDDRDGQSDEDGYDDLDGDGHITMMRRKIKGGRYKVSPEDARLLVWQAAGTRMVSMSCWASRGSTTTATARSTRTARAATT